MKIKGLFLSLTMTVSFALIGQAVYQNVYAQPDNEHALPSKAPRPIYVNPIGYKAKPASEESRKGEEYFHDLNCMACHSIHNAGGTMGPLLDGVGGHRSAEYLYTLLSNSEEAQKRFAQLIGLKGSVLIHPRVGDTTAKSLVAYLETLPEPAGGFILSPHIMAPPSENPKPNLSYKAAAATANSEAGKILFQKRGCVACHSVNNTGGWLGPALDGVGGRIARLDMERQINNPKVIVRESIDAQETWPQMPKMDLPKEDVQKIIDYLMTLPNITMAKR